VAPASPLSKSAIGRFDHLPAATVERARVKITKRLPPQADAMTIGDTIYVRPGHQHSEPLLAHELVHVRQWEEYGPVGFLRRYLGAYFSNLVRLRDHMAAYRAIPFEVEARAEAATWKARPP
jgi:hypothetical protein